MWDCSGFGTWKRTSSKLQMHVQPLLSSTDGKTQTRTRTWNDIGWCSNWCSHEYKMALVHTMFSIHLITIKFIENNIVIIMFMSFTATMRRLHNGQCWNTLGPIKKLLHITYTSYNHMRIHNYSLCRLLYCITYNVPSFCCFAPPWSLV